MLRREEVERIKEQYPKGTPIRLYSMVINHAPRHLLDRHA